MAHQEGSAKKCGVHNTQNSHCGSTSLSEHSAGTRAHVVHLRPFLIVLLTKTGPRCISFRCKITVSLAQGAVNDAEADVADPVFVRSTIAVPSFM